MTVTAPAPPVRPAKRRRLDHVDAMRPMKQAGVLTTHVLLSFAPAGVASGGLLMLTHFSREGFFFVSACMLTYVYHGLRRAGMARFYRRRFVSVGVPYLCWNVLYFLVDAPGSGKDAAGLAADLATRIGLGYFHLYYLLVIMQFYVLFPLLLALLRRARRHGRLLLASLALQVAVMALSHWHVLPESTVLGAHVQTRIVLFYQFYLIAGAIVALHLSDVHRWLCGHVRWVLLGTLGAAVLAETVMLLSRYRIIPVPGSSSDPFQVAVIPFNVGIIATLYLLGVWLVAPGRSARLRAMVHSGSENSYGVYLTHMLFITALLALGWRHVTAVVPWPLLCLVTVLGIYLAAMALTALLARTRLAVALTGGPQRGWRSLLPRRAAPVPTTAPTSPMPSHIVNPTTETTRPTE